MGNRTQTAAVRALGYLELGAADLSAWRAYAGEVLAVACEASADGLTLRYDDQCWRIRLVESAADDILCAGFEVADAAALEAIGSRLAEQGVAVTQADSAAARARGVDRLSLCEDPFGLQIELYVGDRAADTPFRSPREVSGFLTGDQGLGHIVLSMPEQTAAEAFYMDGLGMRLSDHIHMGAPPRQMTLTFLHCNRRHHTLAMVPLALPKRLNHFMLQVNALDDVGYALDAAIKAGVPITSSLGKHSNDRMISFYMRTPSGYDVEYGYGAVEVDDATWQPTSYDAPSLWGHRGNLR